MASADVLTPSALPTQRHVQSQPPIISLPPCDRTAALEDDIATNAHNGVTHTRYDDADPSLYLGPRGVQQTLVNKQGLKLKSYFWPAAGDAKCVLLFVHGHGAHLQFELLKSRVPGELPTYEGSWAQRFNAAGVSVCGIDNQGSGRSEAARGMRFYVESFDDYVDDVLQLAGAIAAKPASCAGEPAADGENDEGDKVEGESKAFTIPAGFSGLPCFISGISLGGCIALTAAVRCPRLFGGAVLLAPMLSLERITRQGLNRYMRPLATVLSRVMPTAALVATDRNTMYPDIQALWDADPLTLHTKTRVRNANEYLRATEAAAALMARVDVPLLIFHSEMDTMCDPDGSKALYLKAKSSDKTLRLVNSMWHVLVKEEGNEKVCQEMAEWVNKRATSTYASED